MAAWKNNLVAIVVHTIIAVGCLTISYLFWAFVVRRGLAAFGIEEDHGSQVLIGLMAVNACHFFFGVFHTDERIDDVAPEKFSLMMSPYAYDRAWIRVIAFLTIGFSQHLKQSLNLMRDSGSDRSGR